jgi:hypothetical protein
MAARLPTSSLPNTLRRCVDTVHELISKTLAIALLVYPLATIRAISRSRGSGGAMPRRRYGRGILRWSLTPRNGWNRSSYR